MFRSHAKPAQNEVNVDMFGWEYDSLKPPFLSESERDPKESEHSQLSSSFDLFSYHSIVPLISSKVQLGPKNSPHKAIANKNINSAQSFSFTGHHITIPPCNYNRIRLKAISRVIIPFKPMKFTDKCICDS
jgi:hypothetical protein